MRPLAYCFALLLALPCAAQTAPTILRAVPYTQGAGRPLLADVFLPSGPGVHPGILFIHGGGWGNGDRLQMVKLIDALAREGYVGFTIDYDVDPVHFPASLNESLTALEFMRAHAAEYKLDPARIAVAGSSAGGELAALVALTPAMRSPVANNPVASVQAALVLNGVVDLESLGDSSNMVTQYLGGPCSELREVCRAASPLAQVHPGAPPFFVGHGTADAVVPFAHASSFVAALEAARVTVKFFKAEGGSHTYWAKEAYFHQNLDAIKLFLRGTLGSGNGP